MDTDCKILFPNKIEWSEFKNQNPEPPFSDDIVNFLNGLSKELLSDIESRRYSDVITFAFFCRKANILKLKEQYLDVNKTKLGRGLLFHIAPSNVPINFGYSLVAGLLAGNINIIRVSSKDFPQVDLIIRHLKNMFASGSFDNVLNRIALVRYDHSSKSNAIFSAICNVRVIWGGDKTINTLRENPIPPRSFDVCFADRYSISAINSDAILSASDKEISNLAESFYNDTYLFDQNACSSPHTLFWLNSSNLKDAQNRFWNAVHSFTKSKYKFQPIMAVDKLSSFYRQTVEMSVSKEEMPDNLIFRIQINELPPDLENFRSNCGYFSEYIINSLDEIAPIINIKYQSMGYFGFDKLELMKFVKSNKIKGLDRIVPIGETTSFSLTWDGYNLIDTFTRDVSVL